MVANMELQWGRKSWGLYWEQLQFLVMLGQWILSVMLCGLRLFLPHYISTSPIMKALESLSQNDIFYTQDEMREYQSWSSNRGGSEQGAIGRALAQVLVLMNDMPASFRKYGFVRAMAERILSENDLDGGVTLKQINQLTLEAGFARTMYMLSHFLDNQQQKQQVQALSWPWRALRLGLPKGSFSLSLPFLPLLAGLKKGADLISQIILPQNQTPAESLSVSRTCQDGEMAEKLAQELLWLAEKLNEFSTVEGAVLQWSSASYLANLSLYASPRVQRSLVKLSGFLCSGLASGAIEISPEVTLKLLILWLPLLCTATHGVDGTIFSSSERAEAERMLEQAIKLLPEAEQEVVLAVWLREFAASSSDWPNLQVCYHNWCQETRKLSYFASSLMCDSRPKQLCLQ